MIASLEAQEKRKRKNEVKRRWSWAGREMDDREGVTKLARTACSRRSKAR
jgi:hypothetical protein